MLGCRRTRMIELPCTNITCYPFSSQFGFLDCFRHNFSQSQGVLHHKSLGGAHAFVPKDCRDVHLVIALAMQLDRSCAPSRMVAAALDPRICMQTRDVRA